jgi:hypothetical protein
VEKYEYKIINDKFVYKFKGGSFYRIYDPKLAIVTEMVDLLQDFGYSGKKRDNDLMKRAFKKLRSYFGTYKSMKSYYEKHIDLGDYELSFDGLEKRGLTKWKN